MLYFSQESRNFLSQFEGEPVSERSAFPLWESLHIYYQLFSALFSWISGKGLPDDIFMDERRLGGWYSLEGSRRENSSRTNTPVTANTLAAPNTQPGLTMKSDINPYGRRGIAACPCCVQLLKT